MPAAAVAERPVSDTTVPLLMVSLDQLRSSPLNPRQRFDKAKLEEMAGTMGHGVGVIEPLVVRQASGHLYEIVAGERRWRAAKIAQLDAVPVVVKTLTDAQVLELMVIENTERQDLNALEEGEGFRRLLKFGFDLDKLAERISRSRKYIYDRIKLHDLVPAAKTLLLDGRITAGHAILIARLKPEQQEQVLGVEKRNGYGQLEGALFEREDTLWDPDQTEADPRAARQEDPYAGLKVRSVRELESYIDKHVRFHPEADVNVELFPQTHAAVEAAEKVIAITHDHHVHPDAKDGEGGRIYSTVSWKRADGQHKSKTCEASVTGVIVVGPGRGEAFKVCVNKDCDVHWKAERLAKARVTKAAPSRPTNDAEADRKRREEAHAKQEAARKAWEKATPAMIEATAAKVKTATVGTLAQYLASFHHGPDLKKAATLLKAGKSAEDILRTLVLGQLMNECGRYWGADEFRKSVKPFGVDVAAVLKKASAPKGEGKTDAGTVSAVRGRKAKPSKKKR